MTECRCCGLCRLGWEHDRHGHLPRPKDEPADLDEVVRLMGR